VDLLFFFLLVDSAHTDCIVAEDHDVAEVFLRQVDRQELLTECIFFLPFLNLAWGFCDHLNSNIQHETIIIVFYR
jgi:hypothetical protein